MFRWYAEATRCYVYLSDVPDPMNPSSTVESSFPKSRWWKRGWTLQELLAPSSVQFFSRTGQLLGTKVSREQEIHELTGICVEALQGASLSDISVPERLAWANNRETTIDEDNAYCLMGIFDIHMPLIYGEGRQKAMSRLQRKIHKATPTNTVSTVWVQLNDAKRAEILSWTCTVPHQDNHGTAYQGHIVGTGDWIFHEENYLSWQDSEASRILWLHGNGKRGHFCNLDRVC